MVKSYIKEQEIICSEHIYQTDLVSLTAPEFIEELCKVVGYLDVNEAS